MPNISGLVATTTLNIKIVELENKIPDVSGLVTTAVPNTKIGEVENKIPYHDKYITTSEFNKFAGSVFDTKLKRASLSTNSNVNAVEKLANKNKEKIEKNMFVYQPHLICWL